MLCLKCHTHKLMKPEMTVFGWVWLTKALITFNQHSHCDKVKQQYLLPLNSA